jgi:peptide/nickel transport system substrate-binding protein
VLRWASAGGVLTWDPHVINETPSLVGFRQVYESLATIDADLILRPTLATSWQLLDPITWRFELGEGVTFHDGAPLSAEDVVFSLERARGPCQRSVTATPARFNARLRERNVGRHRAGTSTITPSCR